MCKTCRHFDPKPKEVAIKFGSSYRIIEGQMIASQEGPEECHECGGSQ